MMLAEIRVRLMRAAGAAAIFLAVWAACSSAAWAAGGSGSLTIIHIGDIHGHLLPRPNLRSDGTGRMEGGLARMYALIEQIRKRHKHTLLFNTGDTIQGSAEAMYTRGEALVEVINLFGIDAYTPGNWEFVYGTERFLELFAGPGAKAPWNTIAANVYFDGEPYAARSGQNVLPPFLVREIGGLRVGIIGLTTRRGPQVVGTGVTRGFRFTGGDVEVPRLLKMLREERQVDLVFMLSEQELANNIRLAEDNPGIDAIFSSDMHEVTRKPIVTRSGTVIVEEGQDGTVLGELSLTVKNGKVEKWDWTSHTIDDRIVENRKIARKIANVRKTFVKGPNFTQHVNPFNGAKLARPIDTVVGYTKVPLHRSGFSHEDMPAVIEGSSHAFLTDAFRAMTGADIGAIRGFRYGTHVAPGPIRMEDLYHFIPIGPMIAKGTIRGQQLKNQIENAAEGSFSPKVAGWTGGWLFNFSGVAMDFDAYGGRGARASNIRVLRHGSSVPAPLQVDANYTYASYFYVRDPFLINVVPATNIEVLRDERGRPLDGAEVVVRYLQSLPGKTVAPEMNRIRLVKSLPKPRYGNPEMQPLQGSAP